MNELIGTVGAIVFGFVALILLTVFVSVIKTGSSEISQLRRKDYGLKPWISGSMRRPARGATMRELEGIELKSSGGQLKHARRTRAPSPELL
ncbi:hypothetical protein [Novosphingobium capsulatum]|uniref:hypothetical protein n=1 Tax=Novosphingobium capsulatum TaxID=13688 RepID=UPI0012EE5E88|nr:hypothetical protein [Novosphingobium capsulatum]WQD92537.1 hypothetical protein U0041_16335 [Novosphingobium capsulatum]